MKKIVKSKFNLFVIVFSAVLLIVYLFAVDNPAKIISALRYAKPGWLVCAALCMVMYWLCECSSVKLICKGLGSEISLYHSFTNTIVGQLFNCITPYASGGQPMMAYILNGYGIPLGKASCALLARFIVFQTSITVLSVLAIVIKFGFFAGQISGLGYLIFIGLIFNLFTLAFLLVVGFFPKLTKKLVNLVFKIAGRFKFINKEKLAAQIEEELDTFFKDFSVLKKDLKLLIVPLLLNIIQLIFYFTVPFFVCLSLNVHSLDWFSVACAASFILMIASFVPLPGGSGGAEGGFYIFFQVYMKEASVLAIAMLLWRFFTFYLPILVGMYFSRKIPKTKPETEKTEIE